MLHGEKINAVDQLMQKEIFYILDNYVHRYVYVKNALLMEEEVFKESYGMDFGNEIECVYSPALLQRRGRHNCLGTTTCGVKLHYVELLMLFFVVIMMLSADVSLSC